MNLPNKLTIFRIILAVIMVFIPYLGIGGSFLSLPITYWVINLIFIVASITDRIDGYIARKRNQITDFGKFADPIADKILTISALIILVEESRIPAWIPIIVLFREFAVSGYRLLAATKGGEVIPANTWGKLKTASQMTAIVICFFNTGSFFEFIKNRDMGIASYIVDMIWSTLMLISVFATILSGWNYIRKGKDYLFEQ